MSRDWWPFDEPKQKQKPAARPEPVPVPFDLTPLGIATVLQSRIDQIDALVAHGLAQAGTGRLSADVLLDIRLVLHPVKPPPEVPVIPGR